MKSRAVQRGWRQYCWWLGKKIQEITKFDSSNQSRGCFKTLDNFSLPPKTLLKPQYRRPKACMPEACRHPKSRATSAWHLKIPDPISNFFPPHPTYHKTRNHVLHAQRRPTAQPPRTRPTHRTQQMGPAREAQRLQTPRHRPQIQTSQNLGAQTKSLRAQRR